MFGCFQVACTTQAEGIDCIIKIMSKFLFAQMTRPRRSCVNNFNPRGWGILYINTGLGRINLSSARLKMSMEE